MPDPIKFSGDLIKNPLSDVIDDIGSSSSTNINPLTSCHEKNLGNLCFYPRLQISTPEMDTTEKTLMIRGEDGSILFKGAILRSNGQGLLLGDNDFAGRLIVCNEEGIPVMVLDGHSAILLIGEKDNHGDLRITDDQDRVVFHADGKTAGVRIGIAGNKGDLTMRDINGKTTIHLDGGAGDVRIGAENQEGDLYVRDGHNRDVFHVDGNTADVRIGIAGNEGDLTIRDNNGNTTIHLDGQAGDIILNNADVAEDFDIYAPIVNSLTSGSVMTLDPEGTLIECHTPYDKKVVGVVSGAGSYKPGIVLDKQEGKSNRLPIALMGKVFCKVDANYAAIEVGDLLTSSATKGYAMKASSPGKAFGTVIGKALKSLPKGKGIIPILVNLQ